LIHRRSGQWKEAVDLWAKAADLGDMDACIEIAKVYEHQFREYDTALTWTEQAINLLNGTVLLPLYERKKRFREFEHRQSRLKGLLG
jgi:TPR repeat protein